MINAPFSWPEECPFRSMRDLKSIYISKRFETLDVQGRSEECLLHIKLPCWALYTVRSTLAHTKPCGKYISDKEMNFDNVTEVFKFGRKEYPNIHMEEVSLCQTMAEVCRESCSNSKSVMAHLQSGCKCASAWWMSLWLNLLMPMSVSFVV